LKLLSISIFGVLGVLTRYSIDIFFNQFSSHKEQLFPYATLSANIIGCFIAGFLYTLINQKVENSEFYLLIIIGFCGGLTTFSSYALQSMTMLNSGELIKPLLYLTVSPILGLLSLFFGMKISLSFVK
jgi:CrcB protein